MPPQIAIGGRRKIPEARTTDIQLKSAPESNDDKWFSQFSTGDPDDNDKWFSKFDSAGEEVPVESKPRTLGEPDIRGEFTNKVKNIWEAVNKPILTRPAEQGKAYAEAIDPMNLHGPQPESAFTQRGIKPWIAGITEGAGDVLSSLTSPLNLALTAAGLGAYSKIPSLATASRVASRGLSVPVVAHGAINTLHPESTPAERAFGVAEMAGGVAGMKFPSKPKPEPVPLPRQQKLLPAGVLRINEQGVVEPLSEIAIGEELGKAKYARQEPQKMTPAEVSQAKKGAIDVNPIKVEEVARDTGEPPDFIRDIEEMLAKHREEYKLPSENEPQFNKIKEDIEREGNLDPFGTYHEESMGGTLRDEGLTSDKIVGAFIHKYGFDWLDHYVPWVRKQNAFRQEGPPELNPDQALGKPPKSQTTVETINKLSEGDRSTRRIWNRTGENEFETKDGDVTIRQDGRAFVIKNNLTGEVQIAAHPNDAQAKVRNMGPYSKPPEQPLYFAKSEVTNAKINENTIKEVIKLGKEYGLSDERIKNTVLRNYDITPEEYERLISIAQTIRANAKAAYDNIQDLGNSPNGESIGFYDVGKRLTPQENEMFMNSPAFHGMGVAINDVAREAAKVISSDPKFRNFADKLDKVGLFFEQTPGSELAWGVTLLHPNNSRAGSIFINPLGSIAGVDLRMRTPYEAAGIIHHTILHELNHLNVLGHDQDFTSYLSRLYEAYARPGFNVDFEAKQRILRSISSDGVGYLPEIQELLPVYLESRRRSSLIPDPIFRSGVVEENQFSRGADKVSRRTRPSPERIAAARTSLLKAIAAAKPLREKQEAIYSQERSERFTRFMGAINKSSGRTGFFKGMKEMEGYMPKVKVSELPIDAKDSNALFDAVMTAQGLTPGERVRGGLALAKLIDGMHVPQRGELALLDRVFGGGFSNNIIELHGGLGMVGIKLGKAANTMKSLMASMDLSAPFRQGLGLVHRKEFWTAFRDMFKYFGNQEAFDNLTRSLEQRRYFTEGREAGLFLAGEELAGREEQFLNSYLHDLRHSMGPEGSTAHKVGHILTEPFAASERAYVGFLNKLRADTFDALYEKALNIYAPAIRNGDQAAYKELTQAARAIAKYVNVSTGRGNLGRLAPIGEELNMLLFSPRLMSSRMTMLNPMYYINAPKIVRMEALYSLASVATFMGIANGVGYMLGGKNTIDPRNSDFGKIKFGDTRLDPGGGLNQYITAMARFITGKSVSPVSNNERTLGQGYGTPSRLSALVGFGGQEKSFLENKLSPMAGLIDVMLSNRDYSGQPPKVKNEVAQRLIPILTQDMYELMSQQPELWPIIPLAGLGMGVQTFQPRKREMNINPPSMNMNLRP